ncbi:uncharacterized protein LOC134528086 isoform X1 [Bacillus rossius redtenbacheri]|uniref:uncharacterized protein LOC134528086 isoform X1 n=1 Tax=Bacillus rossius redtenbacheri TaxID=93214 RepID=UPI002FDD9296
MAAGWTALVLLSVAGAGSALDCMESKCFPHERADCADPEAAEVKACDRETAFYVMRRKLGVEHVLRVNTSVPFNCVKFIGTSESASAPAPGTPQCNTNIPAKLHMQRAGHGEQEDDAAAVPPQGGQPVRHDGAHLRRRDPAHGRDGPADELGVRGVPRGPVQRGAGGGRRGPYCGGGGGGGGPLTGASRRAAVRSSCASRRQPAFGKDHNKNKFLPIY